ncbi:MAG: hypothetical protein HYX80_05965 [Chloroflexi bacterium]|nr:hypothetical protein [Chloroflexota bacterium]
MSEQHASDIRRRAFLKGVISLGVLAALYALIPSFLRGRKKLAEPVLAPPTAPATTLVEPVAPATSAGIKETVADKTVASRAASRSPLEVLYRQDLKEYNFGQGRLFQGKRYGEFVQYLQGHLPAENNYHIVEADLATDEDLLLVGERDYIDFNKQYFKGNGAERPIDEQFLKYQLPDNKLQKGAGKVEWAARLLVGQAKMAADLVQTGTLKKAVSVGGGMHHASRKYGGAFSLYNDVAFCASYLIKQYGLERILILDTDAHAGNGTSNYFYSDPRVLFIDFHQDPATLYPGTGFVNEIGSGKGEGYTINIPLPPEADYECYRLAFESVVEPVTQEFQPQLVIWNGGADPHIADPMAGLSLRTRDFRWLGRKAGQLAEICDGKAICFMMSGYTPAILPVAWFGSFIGFGGIEYENEELPVIREDLSAVILHSKTEEMLATARRHLRGHWNSLRY